MSKTLLLAVLIMAVVVVGGCGAPVSVGNGTVTTHDGRTITGDILIRPSYVAPEEHAYLKIFVPNGRFSIKYKDVASIKLDGKK